MLFAASESAVTKKPRLRFTISRSSSVSPSGFFHSAMSRFMFTSWGIQWFAQPDRYFSHAHLYLKGTSWFTSVFALMTRLSSARTRVKRSPFTSTPPFPEEAGDCPRPSPARSAAIDARVSPAATAALLAVPMRSVCRPKAGWMGVSSSKLSMRVSLLFGVQDATSCLGGSAAASAFGLGDGLQAKAQLLV